MRVVRFAQTALPAFSLPPSGDFCSQMVVASGNVNLIVFTGDQVKVKYMKNEDSSQDVDENKRP